MGECHCSKIAIMQLFHELKQQFPALPDHVVSQCIVQNCYDRETCARSLQAAQESRPPPGAFPPPPPQSELLLPLTSDRPSNHSIIMNEDENQQLRRRPNAMVTNQRAHRPVSLDIDTDRRCSNSYLAQQQQVAAQQQHPSSAPAASANRGFFDEFNNDSLKKNNPSFELNVNVACNPTGNHDFVSAIPNYEGISSAQKQQITPVTTEPTTRSFTSVSLTLRPPSSEPQAPIDISSQGSNLTYSSSSLDPRGFQSRVQISIGHSSAGGAVAARIKPPVPQRPQSLVTLTHSTSPGHLRPPGLPIGPPSQLPRPTTMSAPTTPSTPLQSTAPSSSLPNTPSDPNQSVTISQSHLPPIIPSSKVSSTSLAGLAVPIGGPSKFWIGASIPAMEPLTLDLPTGLDDPPDDPTALMIADFDSQTVPSDFLTIPSQESFLTPELLTIPTLQPVASSQPLAIPHSEPMSISTSESQIVPSASRGAIPKTIASTYREYDEDSDDDEDDKREFSQVLRDVLQSEDEKDIGIPSNLTQAGSGIIKDDELPPELLSLLVQEDISRNPENNCSYNEPEELPLECLDILSKVEDELKPHVTEQLIRKNRMDKAVKAQEARLEALKKEIESLSNPMTPSREYERQLRTEIYQLQLECDRLTEEVDRHSQSDPRVPLGETNEEFYKDIYTGQQYVPQPSAAAAVPPPLPSQPPAWQPEPTIIDNQDGDGPPWVCPRCTFDNHPLMNKCEECDLPRVNENLQGGTQDIHIRVTHHHNFSPRRTVHNWVV